MVAAIRQQVTVQPGGVVEVRSPELPPGARAEVIVLLTNQPRPAESPAPAPDSATPQEGAWRRHAGVFRSGNPALADNDRIDADLARGYGDDHETSV